MLRLTALTCALIASATCAARPMIIRESQLLQRPAGAGYTYFGYVVGIDGDWAVVTAGTASSRPTDPPNFHDALLYHRVNGQWTLDRTLVRRVAPDNDNWVGFGWAAMSNGAAAIGGSDAVQIFKRTNNTWAEIAHPFAAPAGDPDHVDGALVWDGNTLLGVRGCEVYEQRPWGALISRLNSNGSWTPVERLASGDLYCQETPMSWGISGNTVVAGAYSNDIETYGPDKLHIFRRSGTAWAETSTIDHGDGEGDVRGDEIFFSANARSETLVYRNDDSKTVINKIRAVDSGTRYGGYATGFGHTSDLFVQYDQLFRKNAAGQYEHVASLVPNGQGYIGEPVINGRRVIAQANGGVSENAVVLFFDLPETFTPSAVVASGFESGPPPITPQLGSFAVATTANGNHVYRQSSLAGDYRAVLGSNDWIEQSIEADIKPTAFSGSDRWAGLAVRYQDASNYYYVTLRSSGVVQLKRLRNGVPQTFLQKSLPIVAGRTYRVSLQAYGNGFIVRIDGQEFLYWNEAERIPHGNVALVGYRTAVDYDNVVAAEVGQRPIVDGWSLSSACYGPLASSPHWTLSGTGTWTCGAGTDAYVVQQTSTAGDARALIGTPTDDQVLTTRARFTSANGQDRWFGLAARYVDASNYYYLTVRTSNQVSLRKVVNGTVTVLGTAVLPVAANTWYDLRLDAVGNELRAFVNGAQVLQAVDTSHASGQGGLLSYRTAAEYANYNAWQP
jgi:hypothetical protein